MNRAKLTFFLTNYNKQKTPLNLAALNYFIVEFIITL